MKPIELDAIALAVGYAVMVGAALFVAAVVLSGALTVLWRVLRDETKRPMTEAESRAMTVRALRPMRFDDELHSATARRDDGQDR